MKIVCLIPFVVGLIGFDKCQKDSPEVWKHGPEYTFRMKVNASLSYPKLSNNAFSNLTIIVKCRPFSTEINQENDGLQCYVHSAQKQNHDIIQSTKLPKIHADRPTLPFDIGNKTFEILFSSNGVKDIRVELPISNWRLNMFRAISSQLNFGFNGFDKDEDTFTIEQNENSTIGNCYTKIEVSKKIKFMSERWLSTCGEKIHLEMLAYGDKYPLVVINKTRDTNKCQKYSPYLFGDDKDKIGYDIKMESSVSGFALAPQSFGSHTINKGTLTYTNVKISSPTMEHIDLRLVSIDPATKELKRLDKPGISTLASGDTIEKIASPKTVLK